MESDAPARNIVIIGAGFGGIGMAIRLKQQGIEGFVILERAGDVGGAWYHNTYPGCTCDVPAHLYSYSFAPNPDWSETYSSQPEIREYLGRCADEHGIRPHIRTGTEFLEAGWSDEDRQWEIATSEGPMTANVLISSMGPLNEPMYPDLPGLDGFRGKVMHSARWDLDYDLAGKRVASIGTGASAIQYVPAIQGEVGELLVFQRTAPWVMPHPNRPITGLERLAYRRFPALQKLVRQWVYVSKEALVLGFVKRPRLMKVLEKLSRSQIDQQVEDPELREKVTPDYSFGCKRIVPSNQWYPALQQPNVELVTSGLSEVREHSVVDSNGIERAVDAIILGTGFHVADMAVADQVRGRDGWLLRDVWQGSGRAYLGTSIPGYPNFFLLLGPNTGSGHTSMVYMIEAQVDHIIHALQAMDDQGADTVEVRPQAFEKFNRDVDSRMKGTIWETGCSSFYIDETGRNSILWPDWTWRFRHRADRFSPAVYELTAPVPAQERQPVS